jgi:hypothetical protein
MRIVASTLTLCAFAGLAVGCADENHDDIDSKKQAAKHAYETRNPDASMADPCAANAWYGDGTCDSWCPNADQKDCTVAADAGIACAEFWSPADGKCDWSNPCSPMQDEDCVKGSDAGVVCTLIYRLPDGVCDTSDPCSKLQDADCQKGSDAGVVCTLAYSLPDGVCDTSDPCSKLQDADCQDTPPALCPAIVYEQNGKCEAPSGCEQLDADCAKACIEIAWPDNGKCEAAKGCEYTDPKDCAVVGCTTPKGCEQGDPDCVICTAIRYATNGKCEAAKGCEQNDPEDCAIACPAIYVPKDGVCPANQPCDPDC